MAPVTVALLLAALQFPAATPATGTGQETPSAATAPRQPGSHESDGDPVHLGTGLLLRTNIDLALVDTVPVVFSRTYRNRDERSRAFGVGTSHSYSLFPAAEPSDPTWMVLVLPDGAQVRYTRTSPGRELQGAVYTHTTSPSEFLNSTLRLDGDVWTATLQDGSLYTFPECPPTLNKACSMSGYRDPQGHWLRFRHDANWNMVRIETESGQWIALDYDDRDRIVRARSSLDQQVHYGYDARGRLVRVVSADGSISTYSYDDRDQMITANEPGVRVENEYDAEGRCVRQQVRIEDRQPDGTITDRHQEFRFSYTTDKSGRIVAAEVDRPGLQHRRVTYNASGYVTSDSLAQGGATSKAAYERHGETQLLQRVTVSCGPRQQVQVSRRLEPDTGGRLVGAVDLNPTDALRDLNSTLQRRCAEVLDGRKGRAN